MKINIIKNENDYNNSLKEVELLLEQDECLETNEKLELLSMLIESYENKHFIIDMPDPIEAIKFRMEQLNLSRKDLETIIGPRSRISEIFSKKRALTLPMIRRLHKSLNIPTDILVLNH